MVAARQEEGEHNSFPRVRARALSLSLPSLPLSPTPLSLALSPGEAAAEDLVVAASEEEGEQLCNGKREVSSSATERGR